MLVNRADDYSEFKNRGVDLSKDEHEHDGECECGCEDMEIVMLVDEEGEEHPFQLIAELEIEDKTYVVVAPLDDEEEDDEEEAEILILRATYDDEGNISYLADIEDDEEWEMVADAWQELVESEEVQ